MNNIIKLKEVITNSNNKRGRKKKVEMKFHKCEDCNLKYCEDVLMSYNYNDIHTWYCLRCYNKKFS